MKAFAQTAILLGVLFATASARGEDAVAGLLTGRDTSFANHKRYDVSPGSSETGFKPGRRSFATSALMDGDTSYSYKTRPLPYVYWRDQPRATIVLDFGRRHTITRVQIHLNQTGAHGTAAVKLFGSFNRRRWRAIASNTVGRTTGWSSSPQLLADLRYLKIVLERAPGRRFITSSELRVWGWPVAKTRRRGEATLVIGRDAPEVVKLAAQQLQTYLAKITHRHYPIAFDDHPVAGKLVLVGRSRYTDRLAVRRTFDAEAFLIKRIGRALILIGDDLDRGRSRVLPFDHITSHKGTLFAVYTFLERYCGVRWFWPGPSGEVVPRWLRIPWPAVDHYEKPAFSWRHFWYVPGKLAPHVTNIEIPLWYMRNKLGIGHGNPSGFAHAWARYLDGNRNFAAHPEWYALIDGKRRPFFTNAHGKVEASGRQVCTSNAAVVKQFVRKLRGVDPKRRALVSISPDDGDGFCQCSRCRSHDHPKLYGPKEGYQGVVYSDRVFRFVNRVARAIRRTHPKLDLGIFSYAYYAPPPRSIKRLEPNIVVSMTQVSALFRDPRYRARTRKRIEQWTKIHNRFVARDYLGLYDWLNVIHPQTRVLAHDLRYLKSKGFIGYYWESSVDFAANHLNYYVAARLLWNTKLDLSRLLEDYYRHAYGRAAAPMRRYFARWESAFAKRPIAHAGYGAGHLLHWISSRLVRASYRLLRRAESLATTRAVRRRIHFVRSGLVITDLTAEFLHLAQKLSDAGLTVRMKGYVAQPTRSHPTQAQLARWVARAKRLLKRLFADLGKLHESSACQAFSHTLNDQLYRWRQTIAAYQRLFVANKGRRVQPLALRWRFRKDPHDRGLKAGYQRATFNDSGWSWIKTDRPWEKQGHAGYDGIAWYRLRDVKVDASKDNKLPKKVVLWLGAVDESCWVYVNGTLAGSYRFDAKRDPDGWKKPHTFDVTRLIRFDKPNTIVVKVLDTGLAGGMWQRAFLSITAK